MRRNNNCCKALVLISMCLLSGCMEKQNTTQSKKIIGLTGCSEGEANADIQESINEIGKILKGKVDSVFVLEGNPGCGYKFINGKDSKNLEGAYTDVDLMVEASEFFGLASK